MRKRTKFPEPPPLPLNPSELLRGGHFGWLRISDMPWSRGTTYRLISDGYLLSVVIQFPGSNRKIRLINGDSLDEYLHGLARKQRASKQEATK
jgi:hypothetical protein